MLRLTILILSGMLWVSASLAGELITCFTPGEKCTDLIVKQINEAKKSIYVQAFGFTSQPIIEAVGNAKVRGLEVKVILDKVNETEKQRNGAKYLRSKNIEVLIDNKVTIAHNKVMVIDEKNIITGSFNFTKSAQDRNAENVLIILDDSTVAKKYVMNWEKRATVSRKLKE
jgi:phosphatidylserine/phosphatidylglycerophosphate/cardiolipin synthase-like enzyme